MLRINQSISWLLFRISPWLNYKLGSVFIGFSFAVLGVPKGTSFLNKSVKFTDVTFQLLNVIKGVWPETLYYFA